MHVTFQKNGSRNAGSRPTHNSDITLHMKYSREQRMALVIRDLVPHSIQILLYTKKIHERTKNDSRSTGPRPTLNTDITLHKKYTREQRMALVIRDLVPH